jgi:hypothetical protein
VLIHLSRLRHAVAAATLALGPIALMAAPSAAQAQSEAAPDPAYGDLISAIEGTVDQDQMINGAVNALKRQFASTPEFAAADAASPGLIDEVATGLRPILYQQNRRVQMLFRPEMIALFARNLTPAEARSIADFYRSDLGRKLVGNVAQAYTPDATLSGLKDETPVTADQVREDISSAVVSGIGQLSPDELRQMGEMAIANPALLKLQQVNPAIQQIRVKMENEPLTAEENAAVVAVVEGVFTKRFPPK